MIEVVLNNNCAVKLSKTMCEFIAELQKARDDNKDIFYLCDEETNEISFAFRIGSVSYFRPLEPWEETEDD